MTRIYWFCCVESNQLLESNRESGESRDCSLTDSLLLVVAISPVSTPRSIWFVAGEPKILSHGSMYRWTTLPWPLHLPESTSSSFLYFNHTFSKFVTLISLFIALFSWRQSVQHSIAFSGLDGNASCINTSMSAELLFTDSQSMLSELFCTLYSWLMVSSSSAWSSVHSNSLNAF